MKIQRCNQYRETLISFGVLPHHTPVNSQLRFHNKSRMFHLCIKCTFADVKNPYIWLSPEDQVLGESEGTLGVGPAAWVCTRSFQEGV